MYLTSVLGASRPRDQLSAWKVCRLRLDVVLLFFKNRPDQCHVTGSSQVLLFSRAESSQKISLIANQICQSGACNRFSGMLQVSACTFGHVLGDDINGLLRHHSIKRHQFVVSELLHDLGLLEEGLRWHGARLQSLYCHLSCAIPRACRDKDREKKAHRAQG